MSPLPHGVALLVLVVLFFSPCCGSGQAAEQEACEASAAAAATATEGGPAAATLSLLQRLSRGLTLQKLQADAQAQSRAVPPVESWPKATSHEACQSKKGRKMLKLAEEVTAVQAWQGFTADDEPHWVAEMEELLSENITQYVLDTGTWVSREAVIEYNHIQHPAFNGGFLRWLRAEVNTRTAACDVDKGIVVYSVEAEARLLINNTYTVVPNDNSSLVSLILDKNLSCVQEQYVRLPSFLRGLQAPHIAPDDVCALSQKVCGQYFPYTSLLDCQSFMRSIPAYCEPDAYVGNTSACRGVHLMVALLEPQVHCAHMSRESKDLQTGQVRCGQADCGGTYVPVAEATFVASPNNCYTKAGDLAVCMTSPHSSECCSAVSAFAAAGCFADNIALKELPQAVRKMRRLLASCHSAGPSH